MAIINFSSNIISDSDSKISFEPSIIGEVSRNNIDKKNINENKNISLTYETKSIIPMQKNKFTKVITNSIIKDFSNQF